jgi:hypothetical protein
LTGFDLLGASDGKNRQQQQQIPFGDDSKKDKCNYKKDKCNNKKYKCNYKNEILGSPLRGSR